MRVPRAVLTALLALLPLSCVAPERASNFGSFFDGYAVREPVEPASFSEGFEPDVLLPGEERVAVPVPPPPVDVPPPHDDLADDDLLEMGFFYTWGDSGPRRRIPRPRPSPR
jgi:hypothetical protein